VLGKGDARNKSQLNRRDSGANGIGKTELAEKGEQMIVEEIVRRLGVSC